MNLWRGAELTVLGALAYIGTLGAVMAFGQFIGWVLAP